MDAKDSKSIIFAIIRCTVVFRCILVTVKRYSPRFDFLKGKALVFFLFWFLLNVGINLYIYVFFENKGFLFYLIDVLHTFLHSVIKLLSA